ncbi:MAG: hypothetical protein HY518_02290 [Candidatus Aenigmarchaeota archaeon]|nr:hypothetical protein [Candidatus Aenigmarchaeota archaeon]
MIQPHHKAWFVSQYCIVLPAHGREKISSSVFIFPSQPPGDAILRVKIDSPQVTVEEHSRII